MCLIIDAIYHPDFKPLIAKEDIICYKILFTYRDSNNNKKYITPYMMTSVLHGTLIADRFQINVSSYFKRVDFGIHSFQNRSVALLERDLLNTSLPKYPIANKYIVKKAIIPKGAEYWIGKNDEYCSERIVFAEK